MYLNQSSAVALLRCGHSAESRVTPKLFLNSTPQTVAQIVLLYNFESGSGVNTPGNLTVRDDAICVRALLTLTGNCLNSLDEFIILRCD